MLKLHICHQCCKGRYFILFFFVFFPSLFLFPVYYKRILLRNSHVEDAHGVKCGERAGAFFLPLSESAAVPISPRFQKSRSSPHPAILGVHEGFVTQAQLIKSLVIGDFSTPSPFLLPGWGSGDGSGTELSNPLIFYFLLFLIFYVIYF